MLCLTPDLMARILAETFSTPRLVFLVLQASKTFHTQLAVHLTDSWWAAYWKRHRATIADAHRRHWYLGPIAFPGMPASRYSHVLRLVYGTRCECCNARFHHHICHRLKMRICITCSQDNHLSNVVLWRRYGLSAADLVDKYGHLVSYVPLGRYMRASDAYKYTRYPDDIGGWGRPRTLMFFWRPDLERVVGLEAHAARHRVRLRAVYVLTAAIRRRETMRIMGLLAAPKPCRYAIEFGHRLEFTRTTRPIADTDWIIGGPSTCSWVLANNGRHLNILTLRTQQALLDKMRTERHRPFVALHEVSIDTYLARLHAHAWMADADPWVDPGHHTGSRYIYSNKVGPIQERKAYLTSFAQQQGFTMLKGFITEITVDGKAFRFPAQDRITTAKNVTVDGKSATFLVTDGELVRHVVHDAKLWTGCANLSCNEQDRVTGMTVGTTLTVVSQWGSHVFC